MNFIAAVLRPDLRIVCNHFIYHPETALLGKVVDSILKVCVCPSVSSRRMLYIICNSPKMAKMVVIFMREDCEYH